ncbi:major facilitator superfamily domain-containing protein 4A-like [Tubulanus polymorphus]|uniref:major facilitator superfamily domain-containing protein 4A-like n=1 Tax=Tubulanus polymorphus TaxID=672921 RepID=UPI003DA32C48
MLCNCPRVIAAFSLSMTCFSTTALFYLIGTCVYDILLQNNASQSQEWIVFLSQGIGVGMSAVFCLLIVWLTEQFLLMTLCAILVLNGVATIVCGVSTNFILTNVWLAIGGVAVGSAQLVNTLVCVSIYEEKSAPMLQLMNLATCVACIGGPAFIAPFLSPVAYEIVKDRNNIENSTQKSNSSLKTINSSMSISDDVDNNFTVSNPTVTNYIYPFSLFAACSFLGAVGFLILSIWERRTDENIFDVDAEKVETRLIPETKRRQKKPNARILTLILSGCMQFNIGGIQNVLGNLLTTYVVNFGHDINTKEAAHLGTLVQLMLMLARFLSVPISYRFGSSPPLGIGIVLYLISSLLLSCDTTKTQLLYAAFLGQGFGSGPILPAVLGWLPEKYEISKWIHTLTILPVLAGHFAMGPLTAKCMQTFGRWSLMVISTIHGFLLVVCFIVMNRLLRKDREKSDS